MRATIRFLPAVLSLLAPSLAWAGGVAVVAPLVDSGVGVKTTSNLTSLISSELDFSGSFDTVNEIAPPASLNASCLSSTSCLGAIAKANGAETVITGQVAPGGAGLKVSLVLYDATKNTIVRKKQYDLAADVAALASTAPKMVKEITGHGVAAAAAADEVPGVKSAAFDDEEDFDFDAQGSDVKGKTKFTPDSKKGKLEDVDDEDDARAAADAKAKAKAEADARAKAEATATAKAKAEAEAKARAEAEAKARADAAAKAKAEAAARAKAEARAEAQAEADAAAAAKAAKSKKAPPPSDEDADLEAELANFSFGGGGNVKAEGDDAAAEEEEQVDTRSFSERHPTTATAAKTSAKTTTSKARVVEEEEESVDAESPEEDVVEEEEAPAPRASAKRVVEEDEEVDEEPAPRASTKRAVVEEDDEEDTPRFSSKRVVDEEDEEPAPRASSRTRASSDDDEDLDAPSSRSRVSGDAKAKFAIAVRGGYARFGNLDFVTYGVEMDIPVASRVVLLLGVEGASTNRNYTDEERSTIATNAGIAPEQVQDWNATLPINVGFAYKVPVSSVQPYVGLDGVAMAYTANADFAFGARVRGGCDFLVSDNFGFNLDLALGVLSGDQFDLIQKDLDDTGFYPEISGGTVLTF